MEEKYIVYTEIHGNNGDTERWYYGIWEDRNEANEVALELGGEYPVYHNVCPLSQAKELRIQNMPRYLD